MILKSYIVEQNISLLDQYNAVLIYGENNGLRDDFKEEIKKNHPSFEIINLFQDEIINNKNLLFNTINNTSLFNSKKIIFLHEVSDKVFKEVEECTGKKTEEVKIFILSNALDKKTKLKNYLEKNKFLGVVPCYKDNERTLFQNIKGKLKEYEGLTPELINIIIQNSNSDRRIINNEILKIRSFFFKKSINKKELNILLNIKITDDFSLVRDAALLGDKRKLNQLIGEIDFLTEDTFFFLNQISSRISKLIEIKYINETINDHELAMETLKSKIFWKDKPIYLRQLGNWNQDKLKIALNDVGNLELLMKKNSQIKNDILLKNLLINICDLANPS